MYSDVLKFWFDEIEPKLWWQKDKTFDLLIQKRFGALHEQAKVGELFHWRTSAEGSLAEIIILDQFSRNIYRNKPESFACDSLALVLAQAAISREQDKLLPRQQRSFMYLPFMHSESLLIHKEAVKLYKSLGNASNLDFELKHKAIIDKFGRYPHRNKILGRQSSREELEFLAHPNSSF